MSKLLKIARIKCYDPPHKWTEKEPGWVRCTKCDLVTSAEMLEALPEAFA